MHIEMLTGEISVIPRRLDLGGGRTVTMRIMCSIRGWKRRFEGVRRVDEGVRIDVDGLLLSSGSSSGLLLSPVQLLCALLYGRIGVCVMQLTNECKRALSGRFILSKFQREEPILESEYGHLRRQCPSDIEASANSCTDRTTSLDR